MNPKKRLREIRKCATDFDYFCKKYVKIVNKKGKLVALRPNQAQAVLGAAFDRAPHSANIYNLKARKLGSSTYTAARFFHRALFTPNYSVMVVAHKVSSAKDIFRIYKRFYEHLPEFLQLGLRGKSADTMEFSHGSRIMCTTANSDSARGSTSQALHLSEFAFYSDLPNTMASIMGSVPDSAIVVRETTANGLNDAHRLWVDQDGYEKLFMPWTIDPKLISKKEPKSVPKFIEEYGEEHGLSRAQIWWVTNTWRHKLAGNWRLFNQEFPVNAEVAFVTSGDKFFPISFPAIRISKENEHIYCGQREYEKPRKFPIYTTGVDTASGSVDGDFSSYVTMDVTDKQKPRIVSAYYGRVPPRNFSAKVYEECRRYGSLAVVESNSYGLSVIEYLVEKMYANLYRRTSYDKIGNRWSEKLGFSTNRGSRPVLVSRLHEYVVKGWLQINDDRLKSEVNTFVYHKGKPQAEEGAHDDMIMATALAIEGLSQVDSVVSEKKKIRPRGVREIIEWELVNGTTFASHAHEFENPKDEWENERELLSILDNM